MVSREAPGTKKMQSSASTSLAEPLMRDLSSARDAYVTKDVEASRAAHSLSLNGAGDAEADPARLNA